jgi:hypothetical protein
MDTNKEEYVYFMTNESYPEFIKIGWTRFHPNERAKSLFTTGVLKPFIVEYVIITDNGHILEKYIHKHLENYRESNNREFFKISLDKLTKILTEDLNLKITDIDDITIKSNTLNDEINENTIRKYSPYLIRWDMENNFYILNRDYEYIGLNTKYIEYNMKGYHYLYNDGSKPWEDKQYLIKMSNEYKKTIKENKLNECLNKNEFTRKIISLLN